MGSSSPSGNGHAHRHRAHPADRGRAHGRSADRNPTGGGRPQAGPVERSSPPRQAEARTAEAVSSDARTEARSSMAVEPTGAPFASSEVGGADTAEGGAPGLLAWAPGAATGAADLGEMKAREFGLPVLLLLGVAGFLVLNGRAGRRDPRLAHAPVRSRGTVRFPSEV